uniref:Uncharacterized protein n=1 Tax=Pyricularia oryzae (strain P131) TaxID=1143193 RepID=L7J9C3_PYRO1
MLSIEVAKIVCAIQVGYEIITNPDDQFWLF